MTVRGLCVTGLFCLAMSATVRSQDIEVPCAGSPREAVLKVPAPADRFVHVICTKYGHLLHPVKGWFWTRPGGFSPVFYPAQMVRENPEETGHTNFFSSIRVASLSGEAAAEKWTVLVGLFRDEAPPQKALEVIAENNHGGIHKIYLFPNSWGYGCSPKCDADGAFIMISETKNVPQW